MKKCTICHKRKSLSEFNKKKSCKDGLQTKCKYCSRKLSKKYYRLNPKKWIKKNVITGKKRRQKMMEFTDKERSKGCILCTEKDPCCIQFHHIDPNNVTHRVSTLTSYSMKRIKTEMSKCVRLCCNCHKKVHAGKLTL